MKKIKKLNVKTEIVRHLDLRTVRGGLAKDTEVDEMCTSGETTHCTDIHCPTNGPCWPPPF